LNKKKIIVCHAHIPYVRGGAELLVEQLCQQLKTRNYDVEMVALPFKWYPDNVLLDSALAWRMLDLSEVNGQKIDLVIGTKFPTYVVQHENKVIWLMHQFREVYDLYGNVAISGSKDAYKDVRQTVMDIDAKTISEAKKVYSISKNVSKRLKDFNHLDAQHLYHPPKHVGKYKTGKYGEYILYVGRLDVPKRIELLIKSLVYCDKSIQAFIAGRGAQMENLKCIAETVGVADRVKFLGFVEDEDLLDLYANAFAVFYAPLDEDYGYVTLEAFLSGKPVVTCEDSGGVLEFAVDGVNSLVRKCDAKKIGEAVQDLYSNKKLCEEYGRTGYEMVKDINWNDVVDELTKSIR
jgi:glycosyltransferase involved in cell wall biosynthesis